MSKYLSVGIFSLTFGGDSKKHYGTIITDSRTNEFTLIQSNTLNPICTLEDIDQFARLINFNNTHRENIKVHLLKKTNSWRATITPLKAQSSLSYVIKNLNKLIVIQFSN